MNWLVQKFAGAVLAGVGFKLGSDLYETVKKKIKEKQGDKGESQEASEEAAVVLADSNDTNSSGEDTASAEEERRRQREGEDA